jgi:hypothetical protein
MYSPFYNANIYSLKKCFMKTKIPILIAIPFFLTTATKAQYGRHGADSRV